MYCGLVSFLLDVWPYEVLSRGKSMASDMNVHVLACQTENFTVQTIACRHGITSFETKYRMILLLVYSVDIIGNT